MIMIYSLSNGMDMNELQVKSGILEEIEQLFPFHFRLDSSMMIVGMGKSLKKLLPQTEQHFTEVFQLLKPKVSPSIEFESIKEICSGFVLVKFLYRENIYLKGQFEYRKWKNEIVFFGSLWADDHDILLANGLNYSDFPAYDAIFDIQQMKSVLKNEQDDINKLKHV